MLAQLFICPFLFFLLGFLGRLYSRELSVSKELTKFLSLYLLIAIGIKGGSALHQSQADHFFMYLLLGLGFSFIKTYLAHILGSLIGIAEKEKLSLSSHYGSVSVTTFAAAVSYLNELNVGYDAYPYLMLVMMEIPSVIYSCLLTKGEIGIGKSWHDLLRQGFKSSSMILLIGSLAIGYIANPESLKDIKPFYQDCFPGMMSLFVLQAGLEAAIVLPDLILLGWKPLVFALLFPPIGALAGALLGLALGLGKGSLLLICILGASASYITVPSTLRTVFPHLPIAKATTLSLGLTFPINLVIGIPVYYWVITLIVN